MYSSSRAVCILLALFPILVLSGSCDPPQGLGSWASTYGATLTADIVVTRPLLVDLPSINAQGITLSSGGSLWFDRTQSSISLTANFILINSGSGLYIGSEACPYTARATITLAGQAIADPNFGANFIGVAAGGTLEMHGAKGLGTAWTKLSNTVAAGATSIQVVDIINWQAGDKIVIATTDYSPLESEVVTITSVSGNTVSFVPALQWSHFGQITYNVDERAEVGLLTRNILVQGASRAGYFGGHLMVMMGFLQAHIEGVEFANMGQDQIGRYPIHFHLCGVVPNNTYVRYNSIHDSNFRCVTIHGTHDLLVEGNVAYKNYGHCYFLEDGVEQNNTLRGNLAVLTMPKDFGQHIGSDLSTSGGLSSYWITNPQNIIEDNVAAGSYTAGFWFITRLGARGASACLPQYENLPYFISNLPLLSFKGNSAHSCSFGVGVESTNWDANDVPAAECMNSPVANWEPHNPDGSIPWTMFETFSAHHIRDRGVWARLPNVVVIGGKFADNYESIEYATSGDMPPYASQQIVQNSLIVGFSDNKGNQMADPTNTFQFWDTNLLSTVSSTAQPVNGIKIYDGPQVLINTVFQNFPTTPGRPLDSAIGARLADQSQVATTNYVQNVQFINVGAKFAVLDNSMDGGITGNFRDFDGSVSGYTGATVLRDFPYYKTPACQESSSYMLACPHKYSQLWVLDMTANGNNNDMIITRGDQTGVNSASYSLTFEGFASGPVWRYQPIVSIGQNYLLKFQNHVPSSLALQLNNADQSDRVGLAICYPAGTVITTVQRGYANYPGNAYPSNVPLSQVTNIPATGSLSTSSSSYYYDSVHSILYLNIQQRNSRTDYGNFCPPQGCDWLWVTAQFTVSAAAQDCTANAYTSGVLAAVPPSTWLTMGLTAALSTPTNVLSQILSTPITAPPALGSWPTTTSVSTVSPITGATTRPTTTPAPSTTTPAPSTTTPTPTTTTTAPTTTTTVHATTAPAPTTNTPAPTTTTPAPATTTTSSSQCTVQCPGTLQCCGAACYSPTAYQCNNGRLCPAGMSSCSIMCYSPSQYKCVDNSNLQQL